MNTANHWNKIYASKSVETLGWHEVVPQPSLELISRCQLSKPRLIMDVGSGASTLIPFLVAEDYRNLIALDHADEVLRKLEENIPADKRQIVRFINADVNSSDWLESVDEVALWHDRALLHFFNDTSDCETYMARLRHLVAKNGFVIIGAFSIQGASHCSGLPVQRYSEGSLAELFSPDFHLIESRDYLYQMPSGDTRPFIYALFQRVNHK